MNTNNAAVNSVKSDFQIDRHQMINPAASQANRNQNAVNRPNTVAETEKSSMSTDELKDMTETLNEYTEDIQTNLGFNVREELSNQVVVEIKNKETDEVIKQVPPEELIEIKEKMSELVGLIFDTSV
jgi:flagellar protein FlaG